MRSTQRDSNSVITFSGFTGGSGGVAQPNNISYTISRPAAGTCDIRWDSSIIPTSITIGNSDSFDTRVSALSPGYCRLLTEFPRGTPAATTFYFTITGRKVGS